VKRACEPYVRILIRRPHAYEFLRSYWSPDASLELTTRAGGVAIVDSSKIPIPSLGVLDPNGRLEELVPLSRVGARAELLRALATEQR